MLAVSWHPQIIRGCRGQEHIFTCRMCKPEYPGRKLPWSRPHLRLPQATPDKQDTVEGSPSSSTDDLLPIEEELRSRRRSKKGKVDVVAPQVQKAYGQQPPTTEGVLEGYYLVFLALFFVVILAEGLFIALSGFLPETADQFAQDVVYPAFSPSVGIFLAFSAAYGVWKSKQ